MNHLIRKDARWSVGPAAGLLCGLVLGCGEPVGAAHGPGDGHVHAASHAVDSTDDLELLGPELALGGAEARVLLLDDALALEGFFRVRPEYGGEMSERRPTVRDVETAHGTLHVSGNAVEFSETYPEEYWVEPEFVAALLERVRADGESWEDAELYPGPTLTVGLGSDGRVSFHPQNVARGEYGTTTGALVKGERAQRYLVTGPDPDPAWMIIDGVPPVVDGAVRADFEGFLGPVTAASMTLSSGEPGAYRLALVAWQGDRLAVCSARRRPDVEAH